MAPSPYPSNGTDWSAWSLGQLEIRAVDFDGHLSTQFKAALAARRKQYEIAALRVRREPLGMGVTLWGPLPGTQSAKLMWDGPGSGLMFLASDKGPAAPVRHRATAGPYRTLREAERAARRFIAIGLDDEARAAASG